MATILVIDDTTFWRELCSAALRKRGYAVVTAENGSDGLDQLEAHRPDLIILDVEMPKIHGFEFLDRLRRNEKFPHLPVIVLTGDMKKEQILCARKLGAVDYLLKASFSMSDLVERVKRRLPRHDAPPAATAPASPNAHKPLLTREETLHRAQLALKCQTLSGVVTQIIATAQSPRIDLADLAVMVSRDGALSANVLQTANKVSRASNRAVIATIPEAVRVLGTATVRDITATFGVFEAMPPAAPDGFNPVFCWRHSIAVAMICRALAPEEHIAAAYLAGLCHDLGEVLFRTHFGTEYRYVLEVERATGKPRMLIERQLLGVTHGEVVQTILKHLQLPEIIALPIIDYHASADAGKIPTEPTGKLLHIGDMLANGLLLGSAPQALIEPIARAEMRSATGQTDPAGIDGVAIRADVQVLIAQYARFSRSHVAHLVQPAYPQSPSRIWVARDPGYSALDPVTSALHTMASIQPSDRLPTALEASDVDAVIVIARGADTAGYTPSDLAMLTAPLCSDPKPILLLTPAMESPAATDGGILTHALPISPEKLAEFVGSLHRRPVPAVAAHA